MCETDPLYDSLKIRVIRPGGRGYLTKFNTGRLRPEVQRTPYLLYTILEEKVPLLYTFY